MKMFKLPGLAAKVQEYFFAQREAESVNMGFARGATISVLSEVADGRCLVQHPPVIGYDIGVVPKWFPWRPTVVLFGSSVPLNIDAATALLKAVWDDKSAPVGRLIRSNEPVQSPDVLVVPESTWGRNSMTPAGPPPSALVDKLRAIRVDPATRFITRMDDYAKDAFVETTRLWREEDPRPLAEQDIGERIHRWVNVAGLLVMERETRLINYEVLRIARDIAVDEHAIGVSMLKAYKPIRRHLEAAERGVHRIH